MYRPPSNRDQIFQKLSADLKANAPNSNPQKEKSWLRAIFSALSGAFFDCYTQTTEAINTFFSNTTYDDPNDPNGKYLTQKAANFGIYRLAATGSTGTISFTGTVTTSIPAGTLLNGVSNAVQYETLTTKSITAETISITLMTYAAGVVTAVTTSDHDLVVGIDVTISGATPSGLNGTVTVTAVIDDETFQYATAVAGSGTATGTISLDVTRAIIDVESQTAGSDTNLNANEALTLATPIAGVNNTANCTFDGLVGGTDVETDERLRSRLILKQQNPVTPFNSANITLNLLELGWIERVFVQRTTPDVGEVTIYILKEDNEIPNATELQIAKDKIVDEILPDTMAVSSLYVLAPTQVVVNFTFTSISPDTATMRTSIDNRLREFFNNSTTLGENITESQYSCAIQSTIDIESGEILDTFVLSSPSGDITINANEIGVYGGSTF